MKKASTILVWLLKMPVKLYKYMISPIMAGRCRFHPSCSTYALEALDRHGPAKGLFLSARRVCSCHPWCNHHWHDPVPKEFAWSEMMGYKRKHRDDPHAESRAYRP